MKTLRIAKVAFVPCDVGLSWDVTLVYLDVGERSRFGDWQDWPLMLICVFATTVLVVYMSYGNWQLWPFKLYVVVAVTVL
ncbi:hypothetical protein Tco_0644575 [Tanacetum coccineum]